MAAELDKVQQLARFDLPVSPILYFFPIDGGLDEKIDLNIYVTPSLIAN